jgi:hypothetical protein
LTIPTPPRAGAYFNRPPTPDGRPDRLPGGAADRLLTALRRPGRRHSARFLTGYLLLAATASAAPTALHRRVAGHTSLALILLLLQLLLSAWTLAGHHRDAARLDAEVEDLRRQLAADDLRAQPW